MYLYIMYIVSRKGDTNEHNNLHTGSFVTLIFFVKSSEIDDGKEDDNL